MGANKTPKTLALGLTKKQESRGHCPAVPLILNALPEACRSKLGGGLTGLQGGKLLQKEHSSPVD